MEATESSKALETKLAQLQITSKRTETILSKSNDESITRHQGTLRTVIDEVEKLRIKVEAEKIERKEDTAEWNEEIDSNINEADNQIRLTKKWLAENKKKQEDIEQEEKIQFEVRLHETKVKLNNEQKLQNDKNIPQHSENMIGMQAKLPKLVITQFNGTPMDWPRFWGQFTENIEKTSIAPVTKFAYLRELLAPKIRHIVTALPFTTEGYNRAKSLLQDKYGKTSEIVKAYTREILELPVVNGANPKKIHDFNEKLTYCVQALETLKKLDGVSGAVPMTLDKVPSIRGDLVRTDPDWEKWDFIKLVEALNQWCRRNPIEKPSDRDEEPAHSKKRDKLFHVSRRGSIPRGCAYCDDSAHRSNDCSKVVVTSARKQILAKKKLCFNCAAGYHKASECQSKTSCKRCNKRHHTSICDSNDNQTNSDSDKKIAMTTCQKSEAVFPIVVVEINGIRCRALIDSGAGSSYISAKLIELLKLKPTQTLVKTIDMLMASKKTKLEIYDIELTALNESFKLPVKATKVNKRELLLIDNPNYRDIINQHSHLKGVTMNDDDAKESLPVHVILGSGEYAKIKTQTKPRIGNENAPIAELTKLGWFMMGPGYEFQSHVMLTTQSSNAEYERLCRLDVLGLEDTPEHDQSVVFSEFKEKLTRSPEGWYETTLPWRPNHPDLPNNERGSLQRLRSLTRKLQRENLTEKYNDIIQQQLEEGIIERVPPPTETGSHVVPPPTETGSHVVPPPTETGSHVVSQPTKTDTSFQSKEFFIPHKYVIRESAQTTKMRIVYDASARATPQSPSLNECLYTGPPLQNKLWGILVQQRTYPVGVSADIKQAFLQIRIRETERDALKFHWQPRADAEIEIYRFTRVLFGLAPSPFLLGGVIEAHLDSWATKYPEDVERLRRSFYVDDLLSGGQNVAQAQERKERAIEIMDDAKFKLHKWNSNNPQLEETQDTPKGEEQSYAKQQLQVAPTESKLLGLKWDKETDTLSIEFPKVDCGTTKRELLGQLARVYDPLGLVSPTTLLGKLIYRDVCDSKLAWDAPLPPELRRRWTKYTQSLPRCVSTPRPIVPYHQPIISVELHTFGDASTFGVGTAVYSVVRQQDGTTQSLVAAKSRLAKRGLTVPRLELVSAHMATNLVANVRNAWKELQKVTIYGWLDSSVALHWILGNGEYRQFVANRLKKIHDHPEITWRYVPTNENPADVASRGGQISDSELWWNGPEWLSDPTKWPENPVTEKSSASEAETKRLKEVLRLAHQPSEEEIEGFERLLVRHDLRKALRIQARVRRFVLNQEHLGRYVTSGEVRKERIWWIKKVQTEDSKKPHFMETSQRLNLVKNDEGILECHGRIQGSYPIYLPPDSLFTKKLVQQFHVDTLHGGVPLTMAATRETYWVPKLRQLVKSVRSSCFGCKRFTTVPITKPPPGNLPRDRTEGRAAFEIIGTDFAGPIRYRMSNKKEGKSYMLIFTCSLSRAVHLELVRNLEAETFIRSLKSYIARRGRPSVIYSDNGSTFVKAAKWLKQVRRDERVQGLLQQYDITWKFNLSRAPWWGGQFERLIGIVKSAMYKVIGGATLTWSELSEVFLDIEVQINRRPLSYVENDVELPILTPTTFLYQRASHLPENEPWRVEDRDLRKRAKYLRTCKEGLWKRWQREYLTALRERHNLVHKRAKHQVKVGEAVIVRTDDKNRGKWPLAIVQQVFPGSDGRTRAALLKTKNGTLERPVQHLYPLELQCDGPTVDTSKNNQLDPNAKVFRPRRAAATEAMKKIRKIAEMDEDE